MFQKIFFKARPPYILLLLGTQLGGEINLHFNRIQNSKWSIMLYKQTILRNNEKRGNYRWFPITNWMTLVCIWMKTQKELLKSVQKLKSYGMLNMYTVGITL